MKSFTIGMSTWLVASSLAWPALDPRPDGPSVEVSPKRVSPYEVRVATNESGRTVIAWSPANFRIYDAAGHAVTPVLRADEGAGGTHLDTALDAAGNIVAVWQRGVYPAVADVWMRLFAADGTPLGPELRVDTEWTKGTSEVVVARARGGTYLVAWNRDDRPAIGSLRVRAYAPDGTPLGPPRSISDPTPADPAGLAVDASGEYVLLFGTRKAVRLDALGNQLGPAFEASLGPMNTRSVSRTPDGRILTAYEGCDPEWPDSGWVRARSFLPDATPDGSVYEEPTLPGLYDALYARVAQSARGDFVLLWADLRGFAGHMGPGFSTFDRDRLDPSAFHSGSEDAEYGYPGLGMSARGDYTVAYPTMHGNAIHAQRYCADLRVRGPEARTACVGGSAFLTVEATGRMPVAYRWRKDGVDLVESSHVIGVHASTLVIDPVEGSDAGQYECVITDACPAGGTLTSAAVALTVGEGARIGEVGDLRLARAGTNLTLTWTDVPGATDYVVYEDVFPDTGFRTITGTAISGATGLAIPLPRSERYYRVVGPGRP